MLLKIVRVMNGLLAGSPFFMSGFGHRAFLLLLKTRTIVLHSCCLHPWITQRDFWFFLLFLAKNPNILFDMQCVS